MLNTPQQDPSRSRSSWSLHGGHQHGVQFYSQDKFLLEELSQYIGQAVLAGYSAVVVATDQHRNGLLQRLTALGLDVPDLLEKGRFVELEARQVLSEFMVEGWPNEKRFADVIGGDRHAIFRVLGERSTASGCVR